jgi:hypothetical protein
MRAAPGEAGAREPRCAPSRRSRGLRWSGRRWGGAGRDNVATAYEIPVGNVAGSQGWVDYARARIGAHAVGAHRVGGEREARWTGCRSGPRSPRAGARSLFVSSSAFRSLGPTWWRTCGTGSPKVVRDPQVERHGIPVIRELCAVDPDPEPASELLRNAPTEGVPPPSAPDGALVGMGPGRVQVLQEEGPASRSGRGHRVLPGHGRRGAHAIRVHRLAGAARHLGRRVTRGRNLPTRARQLHPTFDAEHGAQREAARAPHRDFPKNRARRRPS